MEPNALQFIFWLESGQKKKSNKQNKYSRTNNKNTKYVHKWVVAKIKIANGINEHIASRQLNKFSRIAHRKKMVKPSAAIKSQWKSHEIFCRHFEILCIRCFDETKHYRAAGIFRNRFTFYVEWFSVGCVLRERQIDGSRSLVELNHDLMPMQLNPLDFLPISHILTPLTRRTWQLFLVSESPVGGGRGRNIVAQVGWNKHTSKNKKCIFRWASIYWTTASPTEPMETPIKFESIISVNISGFLVLLNYLFFIQSTWH